MPPKAGQNQDPVRRRVEAAIAAGGRARLTKSQQSVLPTAALPQRGQGYMVLIKPDGTETKAGRFYRELAGVSAVPDHTFDYSQPVVRRGGSVFVKDKKTQQNSR